MMDIGKAIYGNACMLAGVVYVIVHSTDRLGGAIPASVEDILLYAVSIMLVVAGHVITIRENNLP